jgi:hypothetical protein
MYSKFVAPSQYPESTKNKLSNNKIVSSRMKTFLERRHSCNILRSRVLRRAAFFGFSKERVYRLAHEANETAIGLYDKMADRSGSVVDRKMF